MRNTTANVNAIKKVAHALGDLNGEVVYVGGAVISLYIDDPAAEDVRPTKDVDIALNIASLRALEALRIDLTNKDFKQTAEDGVMCRFRFDDVKVDVMGTKEVGWAPANEWFAPGLARAEEVVIDGTKIRILPLAFFLASKFSAFHSRSGKDVRTSSDLEDITYLLDNTTKLVDIILSSPEVVRSFLQKEFTEIKNGDSLKEGILGNLSYQTRNERFKMIVEKFNSICKET
jgi:predicted nucleotidyltransferase